MGRTGERQEISLAPGCWDIGAVSHEIGKYAWLASFVVMSFSSIGIQGRPTEMVRKVGVYFLAWENVFFKRGTWFFDWLRNIFGMLGKCLIFKSLESH